MACEGHDLLDREALLDPQRHCEVAQVTTPRDRDPRHIAERVYYGPQRLIGSLAGYEERWNDDFAMWDLVEED